MPRLTADKPTAVASASYWYDAGNVGFGATVQYTQWSVFDDLVVKYDNPIQPDTTETFDWDDTLFASVGIEGQIGAFTLRAGAAYDQTPTTNATRDPRVPDGNRHILSAGIGFPVGSWYLDIGYAHINVSSAKVDTTTATGDHLTGTYEDAGQRLGVSLAYHF